MSSGCGSHTGKWRNVHAKRVDFCCLDLNSLAAPQPIRLTNCEKLLKIFKNTVNYLKYRNSVSRCKKILQLLGHPVINGHVTCIVIPGQGLPLILVHILHSLPVLASWRKLSVLLCVTSGEPCQLGEFCGDDGLTVWPGYIFYVPMSASGNNTSLIEFLLLGLKKCKLWLKVSYLMLTSQTRLLCRWGSFSRFPWIPHTACTQYQAAVIASQHFQS